MKQKEFIEKEVKKTEKQSKAMLEILKADIEMLRTLKNLIITDEV